MRYHAGDTITPPIPVIDGDGFQVDIAPAQKLGVIRIRKDGEIAFTGTTRVVGNEVRYEDAAWEFIQSQPAGAKLDIELELFYDHGRSFRPRGNVEIV